MSIPRLEQLNTPRTGVENTRPIEYLAASEAAWKQGDPEQAAALAHQAADWFSRTPALQEHDPDRLLESAVLLACRGEIRRAEDLLAELRNHPSAVVAAVADALLLARRAETGTAFHRLEGHYPGLRHHPGCNLLLGLLDVARGAWESSLTYARRLLTLDESSREGHWLAALAHRGRQRPAEAVVHLRALAETDDIQARSLLAEIELELNHPEPALQALEGIPDPGSDILIRRAWILFILGRLDKAEELLKECPGGGMRLRLLADLAVTRGHHGAAIPLYAEYLRECPEDRSSRIHLAQCQLLTGHPRDAHATLVPLMAREAGDIPQRAHDLAWRVDSVLKIEGRLG